jgi:hypothetical protein
MDQIYKCRYCDLPCPDKNFLYNHIRKSDCSDRHYKKKRDRNPSVLNEDSITFGKYKDLTLNEMLRDRKYCEWLLEQDWFPKQYEYLYNRVKSHNPRNFFVTKPYYEIKLGSSVEDFVNNYQYFHLCPFKDLKVTLTTNEETCYKFYLKTIESLVCKIIANEEKGINPFDIKAPTSWLKNFEEKYALPRDIFKEFLNAYDLPNVPYIVEDIKKVGGIEYKGAKSFLIAKEKSLIQEKFWETILKSRHAEDIGTQYKFQNCFFDFIHIKTNTLYECKLGMKDFNEDQHNKYLTATCGCFSIVYLIGQDCIIDLKDQIIYTTNPDQYAGYFLSLKNPSKFDDLVKHFPIIEINRVEDYFEC